MIELHNMDIFEFLSTKQNIAICITTNQMLRTNGNAIMGKGIAKGTFISTKYTIYVPTDTINQTYDTTIQNE